MRKSRAFVVCLLLAGMALPMASCEVTHRTTVKSTATKSTTTKKKSHPHGGPPGQTKKKAGHPGKVH